jgi:hypothetical protein
MKKLSNMLSIEIRTVNKLLSTIPITLKMSKFTS